MVYFFNHRYQEKKNIHCQQSSKYSILFLVREKFTEAIIIAMEIKYFTYLFFATNIDIIINTTCYLYKFNGCYKYLF